MRLETGAPYFRQSGHSTWTPSLTQPGSILGRFVVIRIFVRSIHFHAWQIVVCVDQVLAARPAWQHLIITCNGAGRLATRYAGRAG